jgi:prepilin-type N-terminal cleavage/methylation domain-containing protein
MTSPAARATPARGERGFTFIEMMTSVALMLIVISGAMLVIIAAARSGRGSQDRSDLQRGGRAALTLISTQLEQAGTGLPRRLAFGAGDASSFTVASLDYAREWTVVATSGSTVAGTLTLAAAMPFPTVSGDIKLSQGQWLFLYQSATVDVSGAGNHGHALLRVGQERLNGGLSISLDSTAWSTYNPALAVAAQREFNLGQTLPSTPHKQVLLRAETASFGLNKTDDAAHPYLFVTENGQTDSVARNVTDFTVGYYVDADCDGQADDLNNDGTLDWSDTVSSPFALRIGACEPSGTTEVQVVAVEVHLTLRSENVDKGPKDVTSQVGYRTEMFGQVVPTRNINTRNQNYIFIDNLALCTALGGGC